MRELLCSNPSCAVGWARPALYLQRTQPPPHPHRHVPNGADHALLFDDARAAPETVGALEGSQAYMLFFERIEGGV